MWPKHGVPDPSVIFAWQDNTAERLSRQNKNADTQDVALHVAALKRLSHGQMGQFARARPPLFPALKWSALRESYDYPVTPETSECPETSDEIFLLSALGADIALANVVGDF